MLVEAFDPACEGACARGRWQRDAKDKYGSLKMGKRQFTEFWTEVEEVIKELLDAGIDKDRVSALLAVGLGAGRLVITTEVDCAAS